MNTQPIIMTTEEAERAQKANIALTTYSNYIKGWVGYFEGYYGVGENGITLFKRKIKESSNYQQIRSLTPMPEGLVNAYSRGKLTLKALSDLPIDTNDGLALTGMLWLPVQAYYAINGVGWATMVALRMSIPERKTHGIFRKHFSQLMNAYMPEPFCSTCEGGPGLRDYIFKGMDLNIEVVTNLKPFKPFEEAAGPENYIGKSLSTTRTEDLEDRFKVKRHDAHRKRLQKEIKIRCCGKEHNTSICDLFYRLRKRSNYENTDMYRYAEDDELARERYKSFMHLTKLLVISLEELLEKAIGQQEMRTLRARI